MTQATYITHPTQHQQQQRSHAMDTISICECHLRECELSEITSTVKSRHTTAKTGPHNSTTVTDDLIGFEAETRHLNNTKKQNKKGRMESGNDIDKKTQANTRQHAHFHYIVREQEKT